MNRAVRTVFWPLLLLLVCSGCATVPYQYANRRESSNILLLRADEQQIERGRPNAFVDTVGWIFGIPTKIILLDRRVDNHHVSKKTEVALQEYLQRNSVTNVKVRINQYAPGREWSRLVRNKSVGAGWRYTVGVLSTLVYTILPGRIFGGDNYNPYTSTINIYSDHKAIAIHEGGHAKDFAPRKWKGSYAFAYMLPLVALYPESLASSDALGYLHDQPSALDEKEAYKILYPAYGTYIGGSTMQLVGGPPLIFLAAVIPGHIVGRYKAGQVDERRAAKTDASLSTTNAPGKADAVPETSATSNDQSSVQLSTNQNAAALTTQ